jgi:hypothetical protein
MSDFINNLPAMLNLNGNWDSDILPLLYSIFLNDFKHSVPVIEGLSVFHDKRIIDGKEEGFWHLTSKYEIVDRKAERKERVYDHERSKRLPWARCIIDNYKAIEIKYWDFEEGNRRIRTYIWLEDFDYLVVLEKKGNRYWLITAFFVDTNSFKQKLLKKYNNGIKKQSPPIK